MNIYAVAAFFGTHRIGVDATERETKVDFADPRQDKYKRPTRISLTQRSAKTSPEKTLSKYSASAISFACLWAVKVEGLYRSRPLRPPFPSINIAIVILNDNPQFCA